MPAPHVLVLNRFTLARHPYRDWIGDDAHISLITDAALLNGWSGHADYDEIVPLADFDSNGLVASHALRLNRKRPIDRIVATSEYDILRAGELRTHFQIPGQQRASATAFRDKLVMKDALARAGVPVAPYLPVDTPLDLLRAWDQLGPGLVVKPRLGAASVGVVVLDDEAALHHFITHSMRSEMDAPALCLAERFIPHTMHHVDGTIIHGQLTHCAAATVSSQLAYRIGEPLVGHMLDPASERAVQLRALAASALAALPTPETTIFHAEIFCTDDGELVFNEVGSRIAGARIKTGLRHSFGTDFVELVVRAETGRPVPAGHADPSPLTGFVAFARRAGRLDEVPQRCDLPGALDFSVTARCGDILAPAESAGDFFASAVMAGDTASALAERLQAVQTWFMDRTVITPLGGD